MIIFCPEAFISQISGKNIGSLEKEFIEFFIVEIKNKAIVANETWGTFRFKILRDSSEENKALEFIASFRSIFRPEELFLENHQEIPASEEFSKSIMVEKTKSLIERNYADIEVIITPNAAEYETCSKGIPCMTVEDFYVHCMSVPRYRDLIEKYVRVILYKRASGEE